MDKANKWLFFAWTVSLVATFGSLFFSEVMGFEPCKLCWFQRIFMYPQVFLLGIACFRNDWKIGQYVLPLSIIGGLISITHYSEQKFGLFRNFCAKGIPCSGQYINWLGFITIPLLALTAFILISISLSMALKTGSEK